MVAALNDVFPSNDNNRNDYWAGQSVVGLLDHRASAIERLRSDLTEFARLEANWDSYGAPRISLDAIGAALDTLPELLSAGAPFPHLAPTPRGGIQAEWHRGSRSLELEFVSPVNIELSYEDNASGDTEDETLNFDLSPLYRRIGEF